MKQMYKQRHYNPPKLNVFIVSTLFSVMEKNRALKFVQYIILNILKGLNMSSLSYISKNYLMSIKNQIAGWKKVIQLLMSYTFSFKPTR